MGIPVGALARRILIPAGLVILALVLAASAWQGRRLQEKLAAEHRSSVRLVFETSQAIHNGNGGLSALARNRGFDRVWVLSATGDILDSNRPQEIGDRLDDRWWSTLKTMPAGLTQQDVAFGNQELMVISLKAPEIGRQVAVVSRPAQGGSLFILNTLGILAVGLILWMAMAALVISVMRRNVEMPTRKLDDRALDLVRGEHLTEASLDRLHAEIVQPLGGHADCMVDLARILGEKTRRVDEVTAGWRALFDALPIPAFVVDATRSIVHANDELARWMAVDAGWLVGRNLSILADRIPADRLNAWFDHQSASTVGVRRLRWTLDDVSGPSGEVLLSIAPMPWAQGVGHLVMVEIPMDMESSVEDPDDGKGRSGDVPAPTGPAQNTPKTEAESLSRADARSVVRKRRKTPAAPRDAGIPAAEASIDVPPSAIPTPTYSGGDGQSVDPSGSTEGRSATRKAKHRGDEGILPELNVPGPPAEDRITSGSESKPSPNRSALKPAQKSSPESEDGLSAQAGGAIGSPVPEADASRPGESASGAFLTADVLDATGCAAVVFDEEARTLLWSPRMQALTGLQGSLVPDLKSFIQRVFPHDKERTLFQQWLDAEPEERAQQLKINTTEGIRTCTWNASEIRHPDHGELGLLWTRVSSTPGSDPS